MPFNSHLFLFAFLPVTWAGFYLLARLGSRGPWLAASWLALASLFFYGYWTPHYLWLLGGSILFNYFTGLGIAKQKSARHRHLLLILGLTGNLAALAYYKYANFFVANLKIVSDIDLQWAEVVLPIGISFFTFTQIAFLVDAYKGIASECRFVHYVLFVAYFMHTMRPTPTSGNLLVFLSCRNGDRPQKSCGRLSLSNSPARHLADSRSSLNDGWRTTA